VTDDVIIVVFDDVIDCEGEFDLESSFFACFDRVRLDY
jgi:hypothetical protein